MSDPVVHFYPDAMAVFVKGFRIQDIPHEEDILVASNLLDTKEISDLSLMLTVKNNPGTFSITIVDTNNKFILPDTPIEEVAGLYKRSVTDKPQIFASAVAKPDAPRRDIITGTTKVSGSVLTRQPLAGANYYEFKNYDMWKEFQYGSLQAPQSTTKYTTPIHYRRGSDKSIVERWAFDAAGNFIAVVPTGDAKAELSFQNYQNGQTVSFLVTYPNGSSEHHPFIIRKHFNKDFVTKYRDIVEQGDFPDEFKHGRCKISPMDRVVIFMTKRFDDKGNIIQSPNAKMMRVFTGFVNTVQQAYSSGKHTITVTGEDVTKLMRMSVVNVNPALISDNPTNPVQASGENVTVWNNIFDGLNAPQIIRLLTLGGAAAGKGGQTNRISAIDSYTFSHDPSVTGDTEYDPDSGVIVPTSSSGGKGKSNSSHRTFSLRKMLGTLFSRSSVHIIDPFQYAKLTAFRSQALGMNGGWQFYQADFKTRRELAFKVADDTHFVFYADRNGHIWFHPPRFDNAWILGAANPNVYIIDNASIVSYGFIEDDSQVYSSIYVTTDPDVGEESAADFIVRGAYQDVGTVMKYGQRIMMVHNPYLKLGDKQTYGLFAKSLLQRMLAGKYQGQITITGRPDLAPGYPVYVPIRNMIYYVETVEHSFTFGSNCTTTLNLAYGRKPWELLPETLQFSANDEIYLTDGARLGSGKVSKASKAADILKTP